MDVLKKVATACREKVPELTEALNGWERLATGECRHWLATVGSTVVLIAL